jgi:GTP-binding protein
VLAHGGKGGRGNSEFATSVNQTPRYAEPGTPGEELLIELELKLLADAGLVGFPNAGKSTLISVVSAARPKIADYPFTTLTPNLGMVRLGEGRSFTIADIPGLIEGAHEGKGLGIQFLRHIERTAVLIYLIECTDPEPEKTLNILRNELSSHNASLLNKPFLIVLSKADELDAAQRVELEQSRFAVGNRARLLSAVTGAGVQELMEELWSYVIQSRVL